MKKLIKKITAIMLVAVLCVCCFAACGEDEKTSDATKAPTATAKPTEKPTQKPTSMPTEKPTPTKTPVKENDLTDGENVTIEANVTQDMFTADLAIDEDESTRWSGAGNAKNSDGSDSDYKELTVDLGAEYKIGKFYIVWEQMNNPYKITYALDKDGEWTNLVTRGIPEDLYEEFTVPAVTARYVRISTTDAGYCLCSIYELQIIEFAEGMDYEEEIVENNENIALNKNLTSNAADEKPSLAPKYAADGDITTRWAPMPGKEENTITLTLDLGQVYKLSEIQIMFESCESDFVIEVCDTEDGEYKIIEECMPVTTTSEPCVIDAEGHSGRYIRYRRQGGVWGSIYEIEVYAAAE